LAPIEGELSTLYGNLLKNITNPVILKDFYNVTI